MSDVIGDAHALLIASYITYEFISLLRNQNLFVKEKAKRRKHWSFCRLKPFCFVK